MNLGGSSPYNRVMTRDVILLCATSNSTDSEQEPALKNLNGETWLEAQVKAIKRAHLNPVLVIGDNGDLLLEKCRGLEDVDLVYDPSWKESRLAELKAGLFACQGQAIALAPSEKIFSSDELFTLSRLQVSDLADVWTQGGESFPWLITLKAKEKISKGPKINDLALTFLDVPPIKN